MYSSEDDLPAADGKAGAKSRKKKGNDSVSDSSNATNSLRTEVSERKEIKKQVKKKVEMRQTVLSSENHEATVVEEEKKGDAAIPDDKPDLPVKRPAGVDSNYRGWPSVKKSVEDALAKKDTKSANNAKKLATQFIDRLPTTSLAGHEFYGRNVLPFSKLLTT